MKILYVVQRYGSEVAGGAESSTRDFARRLAERGHEVSVLTSTAVSHVDWANHFNPVPSVEDGVTIHRLAVRRPRDARRFDQIHTRVCHGDGPAPPFMQRQWMTAQGPEMRGLVPFLLRNARTYDIAIFMSFLYDHAYSGLPVAAALVPSLLHPKAHDEPPLYLPLFRKEIQHATGFFFNTPEEKDLVESRFRVQRESSVIGIGIDLPTRTPDPDEFRGQYGVGDRPYLLVLGRVEPGKGSGEIERFFIRYKERHPSDLVLVVMGETVTAVADHPDVVVTGFVDEDTKEGALAGALAMVQPSYFESFSIALCESWAYGRPALVQGYTDVLVGQARRSGGGVPYKGYSQFEAAVDALVDHPELADLIGRSGRRYVEANYTWETVLSRYEDLLDRVRSVWRDPRSRAAD